MMFAVYLYRIGEVVDNFTVYGIPHGIYQIASYLGELEIIDGVESMFTNLELVSFQLQWDNMCRTLQRYHLDTECLVALQKLYKNVFSMYVFFVRSKHL